MSEFRSAVAKGIIEGEIALPENLELFESLPASPGSKEQTTSVAIDPLKIVSHGAKPHSAKANAHSIEISRGNFPVEVTLPILPENYDPENTEKPAVQVKFGIKGRYHSEKFRISTESQDLNAITNLGHSVLGALASADHGYRRDEALSNFVSALLTASDSESTTIEADLPETIPPHLRSKGKSQLLESKSNQRERPLTYYDAQFSDEAKEQIKFTRISPNAEPLADAELSIVLVRKDEVSLKTLNDLSNNAFQLKWKDLCIGAGTNSRKILARNGTIALAIPVFQAHPSEKTRVERHEIIFFLQKGKLIVVDGTPKGVANKWLSSAIENAISPKMLCTPTTIFCALTEQCIYNNEKVLNHFDQLVKHLQNEAEKQTLSRTQLKELRTIQEALDYTLRKTEETIDNFATVADLITAHNDNSTNSDNHKLAFNLLSQELARLSRRIRSEIEDASRVRQTDSSSREQQINLTIRKFTIPVGLSAPPIIADFVIKMLELEHYKIPIFGLSFICSIALIGYGWATRWLK